MRLHEAIIRLAHDCHKENLPLPVIRMPRHALMSLSYSVENDLGAYLYDDKPRYQGFEFCGVKFEPSNDDR